MYDSEKRYCENKGISLIALIITIIVIIILAAIIISSGLTTPESANRAKFASDLSEVQHAVKVKLAENYNQFITNPDSVDLNKGFTRVPVYGAPDNFDSFALEGAETGTIGYLVKLDTIKMEPLTIGQEYKTATEVTFGATDAFVYDIEGEVFYALGYKYQGKVYYSVEDLEAGREEIIAPSNPDVSEPGETEDDEKPEEWGVNPNIGVITSNEGVKIPLPSGFTQVVSEGNSINGGIVISDGTNEFVWVPCTIDGTGNTAKYEKWNVSYLEISYTDVVDDAIPEKVGTTWGQTEESQITKYKGFYIARYEASIPETMTAAINNADTINRNKVGTPLSKRNGVPWNFIGYGYSKSNAERMYNSSEDIQSGLITGKQWDALVKWLENSGKDVQQNSLGWGNYYNAPVTNITSYSLSSGETWIEAASITREINANWMLKTGNSEYTKANNIYDIAGNMAEWTNEKYLNITGRQIQRGRFLW
jgi:type II secretory pathway pseudopilin PulG